MILFTSDLDQTIIYSDRMMKLHPIEKEAIPVEFQEEKIITFMSQTAIDLLKKFNEQHIFVPVTTRALYQYERIHLFQNEVKPKFAIVNNGGSILIDGQVNLEWDTIIRKKLEITSSPKEDMLQLFSKLRNKKWVEREFEVGDLFYMFHIEQSHVPYDELAVFEKELNQIGWRWFLHGKKLYILPYELNKASAIAHLQSYVDYDIHIAAGDSVMDYDMLLKAAEGYSPTHGQLFEVKGSDATIKWLNRKGVGFIEELLEKLLNQETIFSY